MTEGMAWVLIVVVGFGVYTLTAIEKQVARIRTDASAMRDALHQLLQRDIARNPHLEDDDPIGYRGGA